MTDQPTNSPRLADCTTLTVITPGKGTLAGVRVALIDTDRIASLLTDLQKLLDRDGSEIAMVWPLGDGRLDNHFRRVRRDRLSDLAALVDRYDERMDTGR